MSQQHSTLPGVSEIVRAGSSYSRIIRVAPEISMNNAKVLERATVGLSVWLIGGSTVSSLANPADPSPQSADSHIVQGARAAHGKSAAPEVPVRVAFTSYGTHLQPILNAINATPEQRKQIADVMEEFRPKIEPLKIKYKETQSQFLSAIMSGRPAEDIMLRQEDMNALYARIINEYCAMHLKVRRLLNADQNERYEKYRSQQGWLR